MESEGPLWCVNVRASSRSAALALIAFGTFGHSGVLLRTGHQAFHARTLFLVRTTSSLAVRAIRDSLPPTPAVSDSVAFGPGHRDFSRYQTVGWCLVAAQTELKYHHRTVIDRRLPDSLRFLNPVADTTQRVIEVARDCLTTLSHHGINVRSLANSVLPDLLQLAQLADDDTLALAVIERQRIFAHTDSSRQAVALDALQQMVTTPPLRPRLAYTVLARLDADGHPARRAQIAARYVLATYWASTHEFAHALALCDSLLQLSDEGITPREMFLAPVRYEEIWRLKMRVTFDSSPALVLGLAKQIRQSYRRLALRGVLIDSTIWHRRYLAQESYLTDSLPRLIDAFLPEKDQQGGVEWYTHPPVTPSLHALEWFSATGDTIQPVPRAVSLFVELPDLCVNPDMVQFAFNYEFCDKAIWMLQQWQQQYGPRGLHITVVTRAADQSLWSGVHPAADDRRQRAWYFQQFWHLPVTVAVQETDTVRHPWPDGGLIVGHTEFEQRYGETRWSNIVCILTDRTGHEVAQATLNEWPQMRDDGTQAWFDALIGAALAGDGYAYPAR